MKKYPQIYPLVSLKKIATAVLLWAIVTVVVLLLTGLESKWTIICCGLFIAILITAIFVIIPCGHQYSYDGSFIELSYLAIVYRRINYSKYETIFITNASYNNGYGFGVYGNIPIQHTHKEKTGITKTVYPFITLHSSNYPIEKIKPGMSSRDLLMLDSQNSFCLGICWFESLKELLAHSDASVYLLEDVYLRFQEKFDSIFIQQETFSNRFHMVTDHGIIHNSIKK